MGLFMTAILPICMEAVVECTFPIGEGFSAGMITISGKEATVASLTLTAQIFGIVLTLSMNALGNWKGGDYTIANWLLVANCAVACGIIFFYREEHRRAGGNYVPVSQDDPDDQ